MYRLHYPIDTSGLPDDADITGADFSVHTSDDAPSTSHKTADHFSLKAALVASTIVSNTVITTGDYQQYGTTRYADDKAWSDMVSDGYRTFALNSAGLAAISKTGWTKLAILFDKDVDNVAPSGPLQTWQAVFLYTSEQGTGYKPKLVIEYTVAGNIRGTVTKSGVGVQGAKVYCIKQFTNEVIATKTTDVNGDYEFGGADGLESGVEYHLAVEYTDAGGDYNAPSLWDVVPGS